MTPTRRKFNLDLLMTDSFTMLVHGIRASGKSYLIGDMLAVERASGPVCYVNIAGEDGASSAKSFKLGEIGEDIGSYEDFKDFCKEYSGRKLQAVGLDSVSVLVRMIMKSLFGSDRLPRMTKETNEWSELHREADNAMVLFRNTAKFVMAVCSSDRSTDAVTQQVYITPDLPGRQAVGSAGWFDFVSYLKVDITGPGQVSRRLVIAPNSTIVVRQRLTTQIEKDLELPKGPGSWTLIKNTILAHAK